MDPGVVAGEHIPVYAMVLAAISEKRDQILTAVVASVVSGAIMASALWLLVVNDLKNQVHYDGKRITQLEENEKDSRQDRDRNRLELIRQAGTDQLVTQQLQQINEKLAELKKQVAEFNRRSWAGRLNGWNGPK